MIPRNNTPACQSSATSPPNDWDRQRGRKSIPGLKNVPPPLAPPCAGSTAAGHRWQAATRLPASPPRTFYLFRARRLQRSSFLRPARLDRGAERRSCDTTGPREKIPGPQEWRGGGEIAPKSVAAGAQVREKLLAGGYTRYFLCRPVLGSATNCVASEETHGRLPARRPPSMVTLAKRAASPYLLSRNSLRRRRRASGATRIGPAEKKRESLLQEFALLSHFGDRLHRRPAEPPSRSAQPFTTWKVAGTLRVPSAQADGRRRVPSAQADG